MTTKETTPQYLRRLRAEAGFSQNEVAVLISQILGRAIGQPDVSDWERGEHEPMLKTYKAWEEACKIEPGKS